MKKLKSTFIALLTIICVLTLNLSYINAEDEGYYIKSMDIQVNVNDKREYEIKETLDVYFNEERHGIIRYIPTSSQLEEYEITNVNVEGATFTEEDSEDLKIKIGDEDETIEGNKRYIITYTIKTYDDEQLEADYLYLNVLGTQWDTRIEKLTSTITYPKGAKLEELNITDGQLGNTTSRYVNFTQSENKIKISSKGSIDPYCGVTVNAKLEEGTFKNAPIRKYPYTIKNENINISITKEKYYLIEREFTIDVNEYNYSYDNKINLLHPYDNRYDYIKSIEVNNDDISIGHSDNTLILPSKVGTYKFKVSYKVDPPIQSQIDFSIVDGFRNGKTENLNVSITSPFEIKNYKVNFYEKGVNLGQKRYESEIKDKTLSFYNLNSINVGEEINLILDINNKLFSRPTPLIGYITMYGTPLILIGLILLFLKYKEKTQLITSVEFYPPKGMNSAEVAYAFKQRVSTNDVTTLLYYWASQNHIKITMKENDKFTLSKISELDDDHQGYEKRLFKEIFEYGDRKTVSDEQLKYKTIKEINNSIKDIIVYFTEERKLKNSKSYKLSLLMLVISILPIFLGGVYNQILNHNFINSTMIGILSISVLLVMYIILLSFTKNRYSEGGKKSAKTASIIVSIIYILIQSIILVFTSLPQIVVLLIVGTSLIGLIMSVYVPKRSEYGKDILAQILGFRNFVEIAEKDRLEALLEEDPEYFYNTLPYAQVLGITKKWANKFEGITMQPPSFYETYYPINNVYAMTYLLNDLEHINSTISTVPSSSNDNFGGGGFSGGGVGGGGGSSW